MKIARFSPFLQGDVDKAGAGEAREDMGRCKTGLIILPCFISEPTLWTLRGELGSVGFWKEEQRRQFCLSC